MNKQFIACIDFTKKKTSCQFSRYIQFGVLSPQNMVKIAEFEITQRDLYMPESRTPIKGGVLDLRLVRYISYTYKSFKLNQ